MGRAFLVSTALVIAGLVAKGLGVIAVIFGAGIVIGVVLTLSITARFRRRGSR
jgi:hypothetical protein